MGSREEKEGGVWPVAALPALPGDRRDHRSLGVIGSIFRAAAWQKFVGTPRLNRPTVP